MPSSRVWPRASCNLGAADSVVRSLEQARAATEKHEGEDLEFRAPNCQRTIEVCRTLLKQGRPRPRTPEWQARERFSRARACEKTGASGDMAPVPFVVTCTGAGPELGLSWHGLKSPSEIVKVEALP